MKGKYKKGDNVTILPFNKIRLGLNIESEHDKLFFADEMRVFCGDSVTLKKGTGVKGRNVWLLANGWYWHEDWLVAPSEDFLTDEDFRL